MKRRIARGTLPSLPAGETLDATVDAVVEEPTTLRMTSRPPRVTTTTPGVIRKVLPR